MNDAVMIWLIAAVIFGVIEGLTVALVSVWMAVASVASAIAAAFGGSILAQILVFLIVSVILLVATVPISKRFHQNKLVKTNTDRLIGAVGVVVEQIDSVDNKGKIKVMGQIWSATHLHHSILEIGEKVVVQSIEGVHAIVEKL